MEILKKVVIIGPESTGKSSLCEQLAGHFGTYWCPEYARQYLLLNGTDYTYEELLTIAKGQLQLEETFAEKVKQLPPPAAAGIPSHPSLLFLDTDMYVMKVWCEFVFERCHSFILDEIAARKYDLYLLCAPDLPWTRDELREYPDFESRNKLYHMYKDLLVNQPVPWVEINGDYRQRLEKGVQAVEDNFRLKF